ncbi:DUF4249 domain-containing protein [Salmonirosea aquatica]
MILFKWQKCGGTFGWNKLLKIVIFLVGLGTLISCETLVNTIPADKLPQTESQLTLFGFISPQDTVIRIKVGQTRPVFGEPTSGSTDFFVMEGDTLVWVGDALPTASVTISDGQATATLPFQASERLYAIPVSQFPIQAGKTYTLTVTDGTRTAQATCTIPLRQVAVKNYSLDTVITSSFGNRDSTLTLNFTWDDLRGQEDYYRIRAYELFEYSVVRVDTNELFLVESRRSATSYFNWTGTDSRSVFQSDANLDGTTFSSPQGRKKLENPTMYSNLGGSAVKPQRGPESKGIFIQLLHTDVHYYQYHRSVQRSRGDNPFMEPSLVYTNVVGGLGVFAGYNRSVTTIKP